MIKKVNGMLKMYLFQQITIALLAGIYICFGALLSVVLSAEVDSKAGLGFANLLTSIGFLGL